jgi:hypothetical protein
MNKDIARKLCASLAEFSTATARSRVLGIQAQFIASDPTQREDLETILNSLSNIQRELYRIYNETRKEY